MGRGGGKVKLKQIQDEKVRRSVFIQRKKGLTKKVYDFSQNFGVEACLIVYDGDGDGKPTIWPQNSKTLSVLTKYEQQKIETTPKEFNVQDYYANKKHMVELEILRERKKITMKKYPTWGRCFNNLGREQLKGFIDIVDMKIQACNQRINKLKYMQQSDQTSFMQNTSEMQSMVPEKVVSPQSMKPLIDISEMADFTDLIEWDDPNPKPQKNVLSSQSSKLDVMHNIPPLKPPEDISEMIDFTDLDLIEWDDLMPQTNVFSSSQSSQLNVMNNIPQMQLGEFGKLEDPVDNSDQEWATKLLDFDADGLVKQSDMFEWKNIFFLSEIEQVFSQPSYGF